jgi:hypothetical protein
VSDDADQQASQLEQPAAQGQAVDAGEQSPVAAAASDPVDNAQPAELDGTASAAAPSADSQAVTDTPSAAVAPPAPSLADLLSATPSPSTPTTIDPVTDNTTPLQPTADTPAIDPTAGTALTSTAPAPDETAEAPAPAPSAAPVVIDTGVADAAAAAPAPVAAAPFVPDTPKVVLPVPVGTPVSVPAAAPVTVSSGPTGIPSVDEILKTVPSSLLSPIITIKNYMEMMKPGRPQDPKLGAAQQVNLYRAMTTIINKDTEHFEALFTAMLRMFEHGAQGVFHETYVYRFAEHVILNSEEIKAWQRLVNLFKVMGPVDGRDLARKAVNIEQSVQGLVEGAKSRILAYFSPTGR